MALQLLSPCKLRVLVKEAGTVTMHVNSTGFPTLVFINLNACSFEFGTDVPCIL
jgi:hypothetical protein